MNEDVTLSIITSGNYSTIWYIAIKQIDCSLPNDLKAPEGCLQYFYEPSGSIESFNYRDENSSYPILMDYSICFKRNPGKQFSLTSSTVGDGN